MEAIFNLFYSTNFLLHYSQKHKNKINFNILVFYLIVEN